MLGPDELDAIEAFVARRRRPARPRRGGAGQVRQQPRRAARALRHRARERDGQRLRAPPPRAELGPRRPRPRAAGARRRPARAASSEVCFYRAGDARRRAARACSRARRRARPSRARRSPRSPSTAPAASPSLADSDLFGDDCLAELDHAQLWLNLVYWVAEPRVRRRPIAAVAVARAATTRTGPTLKARDRRAAPAPGARRLARPAHDVGAARRRAWRVAIAGPQAALPPPGTTTSTRSSPTCARGRRRLRAARLHPLARALPPRPAARATASSTSSSSRCTCRTPRATRASRRSSCACRGPSGSPSSSARATTTRSSCRSRSSTTPRATTASARCSSPRPSSVAGRPVNHFGGIFCDREAARFRRVIGEAADAARASTSRPTPPRCCAPSSSARDAYLLWDLVHDRTHSHGDLPFDPFMIRQRSPYWMYSLEELRCDLTAFGEAVELEREGFAFARNVQYAILFDRLFRFPITGSRVRNYDGLGGQLLFAYLHKHGFVHWTDNRLTVEWDRVADGVQALRAMVEELYRAGIDRSKVAHWIAAHELVATYVPPTTASKWAARRSGRSPTSPTRRRGSTSSSPTSSRCRCSTSSSRASSRVRVRPRDRRRRSRRARSAPTSPAASPRPASDARARRHRRRAPRGPARRAPRRRPARRRGHPRVGRVARRRRPASCTSSAAGAAARRCARRRSRTGRCCTTCSIRTVQHTTRAFAPALKAAGERGRFVLVSAKAGAGAHEHQRRVRRGQGRGRGVDARLRRRAHRDARDCQHPGRERHRHRRDARGQPRQGVQDVHRRAAHGRRHRAPAVGLGRRHERPAAQPARMSCTRAASAATTTPASCPRCSRRSPRVNEGHAPSYGARPALRARRGAAAGRVRRRTPARSSSSTAPARTSSRCARCAARGRASSAPSPRT